MGWTSTTQGHNTVTPVRLEPAAPWSQGQALYQWATVLPANWLPKCIADEGADVTCHEWQ